MNFVIDGGSLKAFVFLWLLSRVTKGILEAESKMSIFRCTTRRELSPNIRVEISFKDIEIYTCVCSGLLFSQKYRASNNYAKNLAQLS